jgi:hypothetical protein
VNKEKLIFADELKEIIESKRKANKNELKAI